MRGGDFVTSHTARTTAAQKPDEPDASMYASTRNMEGLCQGGVGSASALCQPLQIGITVQPPLGDHSLHTDINAMAPSPNSLTMYEHDHGGLHCSLSSYSGSEDPLSPSLEMAFDLKPQFECNDDSLSKLDLAALNANFCEGSQLSSSWSSVDPEFIKMEDVFQEEKSRDIILGPTLAALNFENSVTMPGFLEDMESGLTASDLAGTPYSAQTQPVNVSNKKWNTISLLTPFFTRPILRSLSSSQTSPAKTCTLSSPTSSNTEQADNSGSDIKPNSETLEEIGKLKITPDVTSKLPFATGAKDKWNEAGLDPNMDTSKSALADLLTQPCLPSTGGAVKIKSEAFPNQCQNAQYTLTTLSPVKPGLKRSMSPDAASNSSVDRKWEEIKQFIYNDEMPTFQTEHATEPLIKKIKTEPEDVAYNPVDDMDSDEDGFDSEVDDDVDGASDAESIDSNNTDDYSTPSKRERRYFWQYNTQSKGPKGKRLCRVVNTRDPHVLATFEDPVFDPELNQSRYKHNGKARRGDGNDITPNPYKLYAIGNELKKLNRLINDMMPPSELPSGVRPKTRKEKNKLASRACRLKKKAQHEANKVKLFGLEKEHQSLMQVLEKIKWDISLRMQNPERHAGADTLAVKVDKMVKKYIVQMIAGNTSEYVNNVLAKVISGDKTGGLDK